MEKHGAVFIKQMYLGCLAQASYLLGDRTTGVAAVVDPRRDVDMYLQEAEKEGLKIEHIFLTHFHADFVAGHLELQNRTHSPLYFGAQAEADYPFTPVHDGQVIDLGAVKLKILETPGHTPESISIVVSDESVDAEKPVAVLTGDCLFVGDVGRPDLMASTGMTAQDLAGMLYDSVHNKLMTLPDETVIYPGHGPGSLCGKALAAETFSTIGKQRLTNPSVQPMSKADFVKQVTSEQPEAPQYFKYDAELNRRRHGTLEEMIAHASRPLTLEAVLEHQKAGAQVVDTREADEYQAKHLLGSFHVPLSAKYATYCGMVLDPSQEMIVLAERGREQEAIVRLGRIGFDNVIGFVDGGIEAVPADHAAVAQHYRPDQLHAWLSGQADLGEQPFLLDVRMPGEHKSMRLANSINVPLHRLRERLASVPRDVHIAVYCRTGHRSSVAQSILEQHGYRRCCNIDGGIEQWNAEGRPVEAAPCSMAK